MANPIRCPARDELNERVAQLIDLYDKGRNPSELTQMLYQNNPNFNVVNNQYQSMVKGKNTKEFLLEYAKQIGVNEQNIQGLARMLGVK